MSLIVAEMVKDGVVSADDSAFRRITSAGYCEHPIRLRGHGRHCESGETRLEEKFAPCKTRRRSKCLACSQRYERDAYTVASSGWRAGEPYAWLTLTAPGQEVFGCQHHTWAGKDGKRRCTPKRNCPGCGKEVPPCKKFHKSGDPLIGVPVCDCFDYENAAAFNAAVPALWTATLDALNEAFPQPAEEHVITRGDRAGETIKRRPRLAFIKVAEWQQRGLVHIHALIRGVDDADKVREVVAGVSADGQTWSNDPRYGAKVEIIAANNLKRAREAFSYIVKYTVKSVADHQAERSPALRAHLERIRAASAPACNCTEDEQREPDHEARCRVVRAHAEGLGYGGHVLTKSQRWGESFLSIRLARRKWAAENGHTDGWEWEWSVEGRGYSWETNDDATAAAIIYRSLRCRARAPVPWADRRVWLGSISDDPFFTEAVWSDADGRLSSRLIAA